VHSFFKNPYGYVSGHPGSNYKYLLLFFNWFFQGYFNKDRTEFLYKLIIEVCIISLIYYGTILLFNEKANVVAVILFAHTVNWMVTGCIWCVLRPKYGLQLIKTKQGTDADSYIERILHKLNGNSSIEMCVVFGSLSKNLYNSDSDIDIAIVRREGILNSLIAYKLVLEERIYALLRMIPLDMLLFDSMDSLKKTADEEGIVIYPAGV
jgi:predicted nucleotidyltransferase